MRNLNKLKYIASGFILGSVLFTGIAFAANSSISVSVDPVKFIVNGVNKTTSDGKFNNSGTIVEASFLYNGTTYIPMRMVSNMLGQTVDWDAKTRSVIIGNNKGEGMPVANMSVFSSLGDVKMNQSIQVEKQNYNRGITLSTSEEDRAFISYSNKENHKTFTGMIGLDDRVKVTPYGYDVKVYAFYPNELDSRKDLWSASILPGSPLQEFSINITDTHRFGIEVTARGKREFIREGGNTVSASRGTVVIVDPFALK